MPALWDASPVSAGLAVFHLHVHLIPRYSGDAEDPRDGVRHVIPGKGERRIRPDAPPRLRPHLERFARDAFDYIVVDEFHHASARTYRRLIDYFRPKFLLGLTATPERTDGGDLLGLCQENLVHRCDAIEGITCGSSAASSTSACPTRWTTATSRGRTRASTRRRRLALALRPRLP